jgi:O-antigen ligase
MTTVALASAQFTRLSLGDRILLSACFVMVQALFWSLWMTGLSVFLILITCCIDWDRFRIRHDLMRQIKSVYTDPTYLSLSLIWWSVLLHPIWTGSYQDLEKDLLLKLPYLVLPFAFGVFPRLSDAWIYWFVKGLHFIVVGFCLGILVVYLADTNYALKNLESGKSIRMPGSHIRTSLILSLSILWSIILLWKHRNRMPRKTTLLMGTTTFLLFIFLHILAVKSGLLTTYLGLGAFILWGIFTPGYRGWGWLTILMILIIPVVSYHAIPSFKTKVDYTMYDWEHINQMEIQTLSDVERWTSIRVGWQQFKKSPWTGVGYAQLGEAMRETYSSATQIEHYDKKPHNQWLYTLTAIGILGALLVFPGLLLPYIMGLPTQQPLLSVMGIVFIASSFVESTIETSYGMNFHLLFTLIALNHYHKKEPKSEGY